MFEKIISVLQSLFKGQPSTMDVARELDKLARESGERLDWRHSVVDLLKVLKLDSSISARAALARELVPGHIGTFIGTAEQNSSLHSAVMTKVAAHGFKL